MKKHMKEARTRERARMRVVRLSFRRLVESHPTGRFFDTSMEPAVATAVSGVALVLTSSELTALLGSRQLAEQTVEP